MDELHYVSTTAVTCGSDALQNTVHIRGQQNKMFFLNNHRTAVQNENAKLTGKGLRPVKVLNAKILNVRVNITNE